MGEVDVASGMFAHTADKANRDNMAEMDNILNRRGKLVIVATHKTSYTLSRIGKLVGSVKWGCDIFDVQLKSQTLVYEDKNLCRQKPGSS
jgi:hypothetical protein